jgi:hypothetical protein
MKQRHNFTITQKFFEILRRRAEEEHRSMSEHLEHLIDQDDKYAKIPTYRVDDIKNIEYE